MKITNNTKEKIYFDLYMNQKIVGSYSIDAKELTQISSVDIIKYISQHFEDFIISFIPNSSQHIEERMWTSDNIMFRIPCLTFSKALETYHLHVANIHKL